MVNTLKHSCILFASLFELFGISLAFCFIAHIVDDVVDDDDDGGADDVAAMRHGYAVQYIYTYIMI